MRRPQPARSVLIPRRLMGELQSLDPADTEGWAEWKRRIFDARDRYLENVNRSLQTHRKDLSR